MFGLQGAIMRGLSDIKFLWVQHIIQGQLNLTPPIKFKN
jgi:hypothetical protein